MANLSRSHSRADTEDKGEEDLEEPTEGETLARAQHQPAAAPNTLQQNMLYELLNEKRRGLLKSPEVIQFLQQQQHEVREERIIHDQHPHTGTASSRSHSAHRSSMGSTSDYIPPRSSSSRSSSAKPVTSSAGVTIPSSASFPVLVPCGVSLPSGDLPQQLIVQDMLHKLIRTGGLDPSMVPQIVPGPAGQQMLVYVSKSEASKGIKTSPSASVAGGSLRGNVGQIKIRIPHHMSTSSPGSTYAPMIKTESTTPMATNSPINFTASAAGIPIASIMSRQPSTMAITTVKSVLPSEISAAPKLIRSASASIPTPISTPIQVAPAHKRTHSESSDDYFAKMETKDKVLTEAQDLDSTSGSGDLAGESGSSSQEDTLLPSIWSRGASAFTSVSRLSQSKDKS